MFYPEASPWRKETIRDKNDTKPLKYLNSEVYTSNRVSEKMKTVGVSASIGASILGGLVKVTGSASYFNDLVIQDNEVKFPIELLNQTFQKMLIGEYRTHENLKALFCDSAPKHTSGLPR